MTTTAATASRDDEIRRAADEARRAARDRKAARLQVVRPERPREGDEGRRFLIVANASRRLAEAGSVGEMIAAVRASLVPSLADRCVLHVTARDAETPGGARELTTNSLPHGHPLRECANSGQSLLFSTTSAALIRVLDPSGNGADTSMQGCVHVLLAPTELRDRTAVLTLLRGFARGRFDADDLLVAELVLSRMERMLQRAAARFHG